MSFFKCYLLASIFSVLSLSAFADEPVSYLWILDNLTEIDGIQVYPLGNPEVVDTDLGKAIKFDGYGDRILVDANPIETAKVYTVEVIFKADAGVVNQNNEPRFIHIQNPNDPEKKRVMMEIRVNSDNKVYMDGFMLTDNDNLALIDETKLHNTKEWVHAAITYEGNTFTTYVNGVQELTGQVSYKDEILDEIGQTSIGARMDKRNWYSGLVKCLKVTQAKISPDKFMKVDDFRSTDVSSWQSEDISIYPIPADDRITIDLGNETPYEKAQLYDLTGKIIRDENIVSDQIVINTVEINSGLYIVKLFGNDIQRVEKIKILH